MEEVRQVIRAELAKGLQSLGINPDLRKLHLGFPTTDTTSDSATRSYSVIDQVTLSSIHPTMFAPIVIPRSLYPWLVPLPLLGMVGTPLDFRIFHTPPTPHLSCKCLPGPSGNQRNLRIVLGVPQRMLILGRP